MNIFEDMYARTPDTKWYRVRESVDYQLDVWMDTILKNYSAGSVLDLGCGAGYDSIRFAEREWKVNAYDIAPTPIANLNISYPIINAVVADVTTVAWPTENDVILDIGTMHCIEDAEAHATKIKNSLREGGVLLLSHFNAVERCSVKVYPKSIEALDELFSPMTRVAHNIIENPNRHESHEVLYTNV